LSESRTSPQIRTPAWRRGHSLKIDAKIAERELARIAREHGHDLDGLTPQEVVDAAREKDSPLHSLFEWDDSKAAEEYRKGQARKLLNGLGFVIVDHGYHEVKIARVSIPVDNTRLYVPTTKAVRDAKLRQIMVQSALQGIIGWRARAEDLARQADNQLILEAFALIDAAIAKFKQASQAQRDVM